MGNQKVEGDLLYNQKIFAQRIEDLRKKDGKNGLTLKELKEAIDKKTGVSISIQQLGKYENADINERPNINNLLAIAKYYNVTIDYLLGLNDTTSNDSTDKHTSIKFGLSDNSMEVLKKLKMDKDGSISKSLAVERPHTLDLINFFIENYDFWQEIDELVYDLSYNKATEMIGKTAHHYVKVLGEGFYGGSTEDNIMINYRITKIFERLIEDCSKNLYKSEKIAKIMLDFAHKYEQQELISESQNEQTK